MLGYTLRRILAVIPVMLLVAVFVFLLLRLTPGDPAAIIAGDMATPAQLERIREAMGLNQPLHIQ
ncbi:MAG: ABC transporter permease, partial [Paracoccus sp. (in: a-proteobacteria)]